MGVTLSKSGNLLLRRCVHATYVTRRPCRWHPTNEYELAKSISNPFYSTYISSSTRDHRTTAIAVFVPPKFVVHEAPALRPPPSPQPQHKLNAGVPWNKVR